MTNKLIHGLAKKKLLADIQTGDGIPTSEEFPRIADCSVALFNSMYARMGEEKLDCGGSEKQRLIILLCNNIRQILSLRAQKTHDTIDILVNSRSCKEALMDLQQLRIRESLFLYQYVCNKLHISSFKDLLHIADPYHSKLYYVIQWWASKACPLHDIVQDSIVRTLLHCSSKLDILQMPWDDMETDFDIDMDALLVGWDDTQPEHLSAELLIADDLVENVQELMDLEKINQQVFFHQQEFVDGDLHTKTRLLYEQLRHGNPTIYYTLIKLASHFLSYKETITLPSRVTMRSIAYYKIRAKDTGAERYDLNISLHSWTDQILDSAGVMQRLYLAFLIYFAKEYFRDGPKSTASTKLALEKLDQFAQSKDIELVLTF